MTMKSMPMASDVCHDSILWRFPDTKRVTPTHGAHPPPIAASPLADPLPEPWESCVSNETG
jgi:hypothetical protein